VGRLIDILEEERMLFKKNKDDIRHMNKSIKNLFQRIIIMKQNNQRIVKNYIKIVQSEKVLVHDNTRPRKNEEKQKRLSG